MSSRERPRKRWHWVITIAWREGRFWDMAMLEGDCAPRPNHTRQQMFDLFYNKIVKKSGAKDAFVVYFSLEPDQLVSK
ncbi:hypothetical protein [Streptomyces antibioticus]|uniref:hypothetical protein n=1 Tax=Streptomyces antibioticus TaxID=1890 RepID=UPI0033B12DB3